jgi:SPP1 gp7 family putative phage head morphogenesis protein
MTQAKRMAMRIEESLTELKRLQTSSSVKAIDPIDANAKLFSKVMERMKQDILRFEKQAKNMDEFSERIKLYVNVNPIYTEANIGNTIRAVDAVGNVFSKEVKGLPVGGTKELVKEVIRDRSLENITKVGADAQSQIRSILEESINNGKGMRYARDEMTKTIDSLDRNRAEVIGRTETVNARSQAELIKAEDSGKEYFVVVSADDCCDECYDVYDGNTFHIPEDEDMLPPLHPNCRCTPTFFRTEGLAQSMADETSTPREEE